MPAVKEVPFLKVILFALSVQKINPEIWMLTNKQAVFWNLDWFLWLNTAQKVTFKMETWEKIEFGAEACGGTNIQLNFHFFKKSLLDKGQYDAKWFIYKLNIDHTFFLFQTFAILTSILQGHWEIVKKHCNFMTRYKYKAKPFFSRLCSDFKKIIAEKIHRP
jgi:hypothetical protein